MAVNQQTPLIVVNRALRSLGAEPITALTADTKEALIANGLYAQTRDSVLEDHSTGWNFATKRTTLYAYSEPSATLTPDTVTDTVTLTTSTSGVFDLYAVGKTVVGDGVDGEVTITAVVSSSPAATLTPASGALVPGTTAVTFTASAAVFASTDVNKILENTATGGTGSAVITSFTSTTAVVATIVAAWSTTSAIASGSWRLVETDEVTGTAMEDFSDTSTIVSGSWRLYNQAPDWDFSYSIKIPDDCLRLLEVWCESAWEREGQYIITDAEYIEVRYLQRVEDLTFWPAPVIEALVARLTAELAEPITGQISKARDAEAKYRLRLNTAKAKDGTEGLRRRTSSLVSVRTEG